MSLRVLQYFLLTLFVVFLFSGTNIHKKNGAAKFIKFQLSISPDPQIFRPL